MCPPFILLFSYLVIVPILLRFVSYLKVLKLNSFVYFGFIFGYPADFITFCILFESFKRNSFVFFGKAFYIFLVIFFDVIYIFTLEVSIIFAILLFFWINL